MATMDRNEAAALVAQPETEPAVLAEIARAHPDLRAAVAAHPRAYPELRDWIASTTAQPAAPAPTPASAALVADQPASSASRQTRVADGRGLRAPWIVAGVATIVALGSLGLLAAREFGGSTGSASGEAFAVAEIGFDSPERVLDAFAHAAADGDMDKAAGFFATTTMATRYDFVASVERAGAVTPISLLPATEAFYPINVRLRIGQVGTQMNFFARGLLLPDADVLVTSLLKDGRSAQEWVSDLDPRGFADVSVERTDVLTMPIDGRFADSTAQVAATLGADGQTYGAILFDTPAGTVMAGVTLIEFDGRWFVSDVSNPFLGIGVGEVALMSSEDYEDTLSHAQEHMLGDS